MNDPTKNRITRRRFFRSAAIPMAALAIPGLAGRATAVAKLPWKMRLAFSSVMLGKLTVSLT